MGIGILVSGRLPLCAVGGTCSSCLFKMRFALNPVSLVSVATLAGKEYCTLSLSGPSLIHHNLLQDKERGFSLLGLRSTIFAIADFCIVSLAAILIRCPGAVRKTVET
jgi:hypothetical protein